MSHPPVYGKHSNQGHLLLGVAGGASLAGGFGVLFNLIHAQPILAFIAIAGGLIGLLAATIVLSPSQL